MSEPKPQAPQDAAHFAADTLGRQMLEQVVDQFKLVPEAWHKLSEAQQDQTIERLRVVTRRIVEEALRILFRGEYPACIANLERVNFSGGIKANLTIEKNAHSRHELADAVGRQVIVVIGNPEQYLARMEQVKAEAKQKDLFSDTERTYTGEQDQPGYRSDRPAEKPAVSWADLNSVMASIEDLELDDTDAAPLWEQALNILSAVHVYPDREAASKWTEQECMVAWKWAKDMLQAPDTAGARPYWLPMPTPPEGEDGGINTDSSGTLSFNGADPADIDDPESEDSDHATDDAA